MTDLESELFGKVEANLPSSDGVAYELELCQQGDEAIEAVRAALAAERPFSMAFLDVRMPPGPDGVETAERIRALDPNINIVFVTGYADLHPDSIAQRVTPIDKLLYCQKPMQAIELQQFAHALSAKWQAERNLAATAQDLLATKERLQHLLTSSPAVIYSCAPGLDYAATFVSDNIEAILGYPTSKFLDNPSFWLDHIHPEDMPNIRAKIEQVFRHQQVVTEYRFRHKDGQYRWLLDETRVVSDADGKPIELVGYCIDITDRKTQQATLEHQALHDALTGLPNRNLLVDRLDHGLKLAQRDRTSLALLLLDLDHFKDVNDTLGHGIGDELLRQVTVRIQGLIRTSDTLARLGGDEFAIIQLGQPDGAASLAQRINDVLARPFELHGHEVVIGSSVGIALYPEDQTDPDHLLRNADLALYRAKAEGRGVYRFFEQNMNIKLQQRKSLEAALRRALSDDQFELHYQPQIGLDGERITGVEALIRWHHPERGMIPPADFIPLAEETGIIIPITEWVLRRACLDTRDWANLS
ncbi:MAG: diguanylate cyclase, partial [Alphaproteobacteria bacterium]|nr:diguanylate cyclase [Alphaproteobacteria bacterium]